jgi:uncharacterized protein YbjT (DUF2867 family)
MYTIMGVTGKVGGAAARSLLDRGERLCVVVRDRAKGAAWADRGCEVAIADLDDAKALSAAFEGAGRQAALRKLEATASRSIRRRRSTKPSTAASPGWRSAARGARRRATSTLRR